MANSGVLAAKVIGEGPSGCLRPVQLLAEMMLSDDILMRLEPKTHFIIYNLNGKWKTRQTATYWPSWLTPKRV
jgi:hypothetical protein